ncbi:MAG: DUF4011 domain-containing protein [Azoarcus sp.]|nr:DUF4011 domain-containing protein [Azoarcus sp.]
MLNRDDIAVYEVMDCAASGIRLQAECPRRGNLALLACRFPFVRAIAVHNETGNDLAGIELTIDLAVGNAAAQRFVYREEKTIGAGNAVRFAGRARFAEFDSLFNARRGEERAVLTMSARPAQDIRGEENAWPLLTVTVEIGAADEFLDLPGLRHAIAAFVQPNSHAVTRLLQAASDFLLKKTGTGALEGYEAGFGRAKLIAGAIYQAICNARIVRADAPESPAAAIRKIKTTGELLAERSGADIDLAVAYAACCEAAGLHPIIVIAATRVFPAVIAVSDLEYSLVLGAGKGFEFLGEKVIGEPGVIANLIETKTIVPVELDGIPPGGHAAGFRTATKKACEYVRGATQELEAAVVISQCRKDGIFPLPGSLSDEEALQAGDASRLRAGPFVSWPPVPHDSAPETHETSEAPETREIPEAPEAEEDAAAAIPECKDDSPARIRQWKRALFDFDPRDPLLGMPGHDRTIALIVPDGMLGEIGEVLRKGRKLHCASLEDSSFQTVDKDCGDATSSGFVKNRFASDRCVFSGLDRTRHAARLRALKRAAETLEQETGSHCLYLTLGALVHPGPSGKEAKAPLFLLPVRLGGGLGTGAYYFIPGDEDAAAQPNLCLLEWLRITQGLTFDALSGLDTSEADGGVDSAFAKIRASLLEARLPYRIDETATLAVLECSAFHIWKDLDRNWPILMENPVVRHLVEWPGESFEQSAPSAGVVDESKLLPPLPADGSQMAAIAMAAEGKSFILNGAPGTGKSQTIANLIAHALKMGKRVLFVSGKEAALDAVGQRLHAAGLKDFTLDVHGASVSMCAIRKQLKRSLRATANGNKAAWKAALARYDDALAALRDYPDRVHSVNAADFSLWTAHDTLVKLGEGPSWNLDPRFVGKIDVPGMKDALTEAVHIFRQIGALRDDPWLLVGLDDLGTLTFTTLTRALTELRTARRKLDGFARGWPDALRELRPGRYLAAMNACLAAAQADLLPGKAHFQDIARPGWRDAAAALRQELLSFLETHRDTLAALTPELVDAPLLNDWIFVAARLDKARFFAELRRKSTRVAVAALVQPGADLHGGNLLAALRAAQTVRDQAAELRSHISSMAGLVLPAEWAAYRPRALEEFDAAVQLAQLAVWLEWHAPAAWLKAQEPRAVSEIEALKEVAAAWTKWLAVVGASERSIAQWLGRRSWIEAWDNDAPHWTDDIAGTGLLQLQRHARLRKAFQAIDQAGGRDLADKLANRAFLLDEAGSVMQRGLAAASLRERLVANGLTAFDDTAQARAILTFQESVRELRRLSVSTAPARLLARRAFRADGVQGDMAALLRQIERKRGGMSLRELSARYPEALLALTPVFLMSPGSVAHYLDAGSLKFDIVVFDEASRIRMPEAISAMGRGASTVIVGDPKQIPPGLMAANGAEETRADGKAKVETPESILGEAVDAGLPQLHLAWHYRSENEDLIAFSNAHYYENELITLPGACRNAGAGIVWRRLEGEFSPEKDRGNPAEAQAVVDEIRARIHDPARRRESIGVVCFDLRQRDLILDMLEESGDPLIHAALTEPSGSGQRLFVKDAGSAQGEERDIILCSLMFSPDPATNALPLDFGPLSGKDGGRWLNVAITRARRQLALFTSFDPAHIGPAHASAAGLRDLKRYMEFAAGTGEIETPKGGGSEDRGGLVSKIAAALEARGYLAQAGVGRSAFRVDLAVKKPGDEGWRLAIMVDGPAWRSRPTVADRDGAPTLLRDIMKWPAVARVWLPGWLRDPEGNLSRLIERIEAPSRRKNAPVTSLQVQAGIVTMGRAVNSAAN